MAMISQKWGLPEGGCRAAEAVEARRGQVGRGHAEVDWRGLERLGRSVDVKQVGEVFRAQALKLSSSVVTGGRGCRDDAGWTSWRE